MPADRCCNILTSYMSSAQKGLKDGFLNLYFIGSSLLFKFQIVMLTVKRYHRKRAKIKKK